MQVIMIEDFWGYVESYSHKYGKRYYPVYMDINGYWRYYASDNGNLYFDSVDAVINFFKS